MGLCFLVVGMVVVVGLLVVDLVAGCQIFHGMVGPDFAVGLGLRVGRDVRGEGGGLRVGLGGGLGLLIGRRGVGLLVGLVPIGFPFFILSPRRSHSTTFRKLWKAISRASDIDISRASDLDIEV